MNAVKPVSSGSEPRVAQEAKINESKANQRRDENREDAAKKTDERNDKRADERRELAEA